MRIKSPTEVFTADTAKTCCQWAELDELPVSPRAALKSDPGPGKKGQGYTPAKPAVCTFFCTLYPCT
jgi:hypothetical protein